MAVAFARALKIPLKMQPIFISKVNTVLVVALPFFFFVNKNLNFSFGSDIVKLAQSVIIFTTVLSAVAYASIFYKAVKSWW
jgi:hypothetical protein